MKYTIFVTVEDFLNNGGQLEEGREIFSGLNSGQFVGTFDRLQADGTVGIKMRFGTKYANCAYTYVQIEAEPVWK